MAVIIDVFRAFTTAAGALANGATKVIIVRDVEEALRLRAAGVRQLCMGQVGRRAPSGFDLGNSSFEASQADLDGRAIIQRTSVESEPSPSG
jgi:2-phosphosulfolactate phosphatase